MTTIVWFRQDLRVDDHPALLDAAGRGAVVPVYIHAPGDEGAWPVGEAAAWWLHHSLAALAAELAKRGSPLVLRRGSAATLLPELVRETKAERVVCSRRYEPAAAAVESAAGRALAAAGIAFERFESSLLFAPESLRTGGGGAYQVYTPFARACRKLPAPAKPKSAPKTLAAPAIAPTTLRLEELALLPTRDWAARFIEVGRPGEVGAKAALARFLDGAIASYAAGRDRPAEVGTSRLSPHLHIGSLSPRRVWHAVGDALDARALTSVDDAEKFRAELLWREFAHHVLVHWPSSDREPLRPAYAAFPWRDDPKALAAWRRGRTGYPLVDAGMRELWTTGWMHNRVRMVVASFLVKHLLLPWQEGTRWFWNTLVDADLANNSLGWQWAAGCGADAAPYFRIFNPTLQARKFDPEGAYVRRWVPELAELPTKLLHEPWTDGGVLRRTGYPRPIVDHAEARARALAALATVTGSASAEGDD